MKNLNEKLETSLNRLKKEAQIENMNFITESTVSIYGANKDEYIEADNKASVKFQLSFDAKSWGIKNTYVSIDEIIEIPYTISKSNDDGDVIEVYGQVTVDLAKLERDDIESMGSCTVGELELWLDENYQVNYNKSTIEIIK